LASKNKVTYLPPIYSSKKIREGVIAIINLVQAQESNQKAAN